MKISKDKLKIINNISLESVLFFVNFNLNYDLKTEFLSIINLQFDRLIDNESVDFVTDIWNSEHQIIFYITFVIYYQNR